LHMSKKSSTFAPAKVFTNMTDLKLLHAFIADWQGKGYEKGDTQRFWLGLIHALGVLEPTQHIIFEGQVHHGTTIYMDGYIPSTKVLIEQKSISKDLGKGYTQSDGQIFTPYEQAKRYADQLPNSLRPRWIITCNFREFWIYSLEQPHSQPVKVLLENLEKEYYLLEILVKEKSEELQREEELSMEAGKIVGAIYDQLILQYLTPDAPETLRSLNQLCVRLVFLFFAEDADILGEKNAFHDYLAKFPASQWRRALIELFRVLDTPLDQRDPYLEDDLRDFPYVNGGLFSDESIEIPQFTDELRELILNHASIGFDWSAISPTIFGGVFESTLNPETRRSGGMHYTSIENIHKVIDPLFLNALKHEFEDCTTKKQYLAFQDKLASLTFFDPACGSGNFLTESFVSLRRLENQVIAKLQGGQLVMGDIASPVKVSIHQFYGIEINDFAVSVATTALWIAELQMLRETHKVAQFNDQPLPLKTYQNIHEGNALRLNWETLFNGSGDSGLSGLSGSHYPDYIMGNPPFIGARMKSADQADDLISVFGAKWKNVGNMDYVSGWYMKAAQMMQAHPSTRAALVSTNSITQGEQVAALWKPLFEQYGIQFNFAYPTFRWDSESSLKAHVHCVIIGFSRTATPTTRLYRPDGTWLACTNINGYLVDAPSICIESRNKPLCSVPEMVFGNMPNDGGKLLLTEAEKDELVLKHPQIAPYVRRFLGAEEFINNKKRFCLWLVDCPPSILRTCPLVLERIDAIRSIRANSPRPGTRKMADFPTLFGEIRQPDGNYLLVPGVSSEKRKYIPVGFLSPDVIASNATLIIPNATLFHFGVLTSNVHMAWMRVVCGRLEMRYRYSANIVYNNFPWPGLSGDAGSSGLSGEMRARIESTAQAILNARANHPECSLADLYDDTTMPPDLRQAHRDNDRAVMLAYGFTPGKTSESEAVAALFQQYQQLTQ